MVAPFSLPEVVYVGRDALASLPGEVKKFNAGRVLLVTDAGVMAAGLKNGRTGYRGGRRAGGHFLRGGAGPQFIIEMESLENSVDLFFRMKRRPGTNALKYSARIPGQPALPAVKKAKKWRENERRLL